MLAFGEESAEFIKRGCASDACCQSGSQTRLTDELASEPIYIKLAIIRNTLTSSPVRTTRQMSLKKDIGMRTEPEPGGPAFGHIHS